VSFCCCHLYICKVQAHTSMSPGDIFCFFKNIHQICLHILNLQILFISMINKSKIFLFHYIILKNHMFSYIYIYNTSHILQNKFTSTRRYDFNYIFLYFQVDKSLICINIVSTFHIIVIIYIYIYLKILKNHPIWNFFFILLFIYELPQTLCSTYYKL
jgi:hypothetical protein